MVVGIAAELQEAELNAEMRRRVQALVLKADREAERGLRHERLIRDAVPEARFQAGLVLKANASDVKVLAAKVHAAIMQTREVAPRVDDETKRRLLALEGIVRRLDDRIAALETKRSSSRRDDDAASVSGRSVASRASSRRHRTRKAPRRLSNEVIEEGSTEHEKPKKLADVVPRAVVTHDEPIDNVPRASLDSVKRASLDSVNKRASTDSVKRVSADSAKRVHSAKRETPAPAAQEEPDEHVVPPEEEIEEPHFDEEDDDHSGEEEEEEVESRSPSASYETGQTDETLLLRMERMMDRVEDLETAYDSLAPRVQKKAATSMVTQYVGELDERVQSLASQVVELMAAETRRLERLEASVADVAEQCRRGFVDTAKLRADTERQHQHSELRLDDLQASMDTRQPAGRRRVNDMDVQLRDIKDAILDQKRNFDAERNVLVAELRRAQALNRRPTPPDNGTSSNKPSPRLLTGASLLEGLHEFAKK